MSILPKLIEIQKEASQFGLEYPDAFNILNQIIDECREIKEDIEQKASQEKIQEEIGDLLHAVIYLCIFSKFDVEETLEKSNTKFERRLVNLKKLTKTKGLDNLQGKSLKYILELWEEVKSQEVY